MSAPSALPLRAALDAGLSELDARTSHPQRVVVVGGGMAGISTAYWLARAGNAVTVLEAAPAPAAAAAALSATATTPSIPGSAASYTGLLAPSSTLAPFFARPHLFRAQKVQWCPRTQYMHPNLRVGLFEKGSDVAQRVRMGITRFSTRSNFQPTLARLYGLGIWNQALVERVSQEWQAQGTKGSAPLSLSRSQGSLSVVFDDRVFADMLHEAATNRSLVGEEASQLVGAPTVPTPTSSAASSSASPVSGRIYALSDQELLARLPSLEPRLFKMAGVLSFADEWTIDHMLFLDRMRREAEKRGVKFQYDTTVHALVTQQQQQQQAQSATVAANSSSAVVPVPSSSFSDSRIVSAQTSRGVVEGDAFILCAGAHSKRIVHASRLTGAIQQPIPTFTTKTHHFEFPNPDAQMLPPAAASSSASSVAPASSSSSGRIFPSTSVTLPETHTVVSALPHVVRVASGDDLNQLDSPVLLPSANDALAESHLLASTALHPRLEPARLQGMLTDLSGVWPRVDKAMISQGGATVPRVSLRNWSFDGKPLMGPYVDSIPNLFINGAHGNQGWTHAVAAGQHVANIVSGLPTFLQQDAFDPRRFDIGAHQGK